DCLARGLERFAVPPLPTSESGERRQVAGALLDVCRILQPRIEVEHLLGSAEIASMDANLEHGRQRAQDDSGLANLVFRNLGEGSERLRPAAGHVERVGGLAQDLPLVQAGCRTCGRARAPPRVTPA